MLGVLKTCLDYHLLWIAFNSTDNIHLIRNHGTNPTGQSNGVEQMDVEVMLRVMPAPVAWYMRKFELQAVLDRYYDPRLVLIDIAANFIKEGHAGRIPAVLEQINGWLTGPGADLDVAPISEREVERYYRSDKALWALYLRVRKADRFVTTRILGRRYNYILPGKVRR